MERKKTVDVYCGTKSVSKVLDDRGFDNLSIDFNSRFNPDLVLDMIYYEKKKIPKKYHRPYFMWFSPPCITFSLSGNSFYMGFPTSAKAYIGYALAFRCIQMIQDLQPKYYVIENPRAGLRKTWFMQPLELTTVSYCQYGFKNMKPTDLFNNFGYKGKLCKNGMSCHESAPRSSGKGTSGEKNREVRGKIPPLLIHDILDYLEEKDLKDKEE